jgi:hypothetical protein
MKLKSTILIAIITFSANMNVYSQSQRYVNYTTKNGMPSNMIYDVKSDSLGHIWAISERGVIKLNGDNIELITTSQGLLSNDNFFLFVSNSDIYVRGLYGVSRISRFNNIVNYNFPKVTFPTFFMFLVDTQGNIYCDYNKGVIKFNIQNEKSILGLKDEEYGYLTFLNNDKVHIYSCDVRTGIFYNSFVYSEAGLQKSAFNPSGLCVRGSKLNNYVKIDSNSELLVFVDGLKYFINGKVYSEKNFLESSRRLSNSMPIKYKEGVLLPLSDGLYHYNYKNNSLTKVFNKKNCTGVTIDFEGNIWVSTLNNGLFKLVPQLMDIKINDENIIKIAGDQNKVWFATSGNQVVSLRDNVVFSHDVFEVKFFKYLRNNLWFGGSNGLYLNNLILSKLPLKAISSKNEILAATSPLGVKLFKLEDHKQFQDWKSTEADIKTRSNAILLQNDIFYTGNQSGLYWGRIADKELFPICLDDQKDGVSVNGIEESAESDVWVSTEGDGVFLVKNKESVLHFRKELLDGNIHTMKVDEKGRVWLSTRKGVNCIKKVGSEYKVYTYTSFHGLPSDYVFDTYCYQDTLFVATDAGLVQMDVRVAENTNYNVAPKIYLNHIDLAYNGKNFSIPVDSTIMLNHDQNNLTFNYSGISYRSNGNISYQYRLLPQFKDWRTTTTDNLNFNLTPGSYMFEVKAINAIGIQSEFPAVYSFIIRPHFTDTWWFRVLSIIFITGMMSYSLILLFNYRKRKSAEKNKAERQITELKLKSLQAQLNPHFIFNALNAIQQFINVENKRSANDYLTRFARLMRLYLVGSENQFITLEQELEILKLYTNLEHLRFSNIFTYSFEIDEDIKLDQYIVPAMLLQPHVENAIRHGLTTSDNKDNRLTVTVRRCEGGICCVVEDNGIGRQQSLELKQKGKTEHRSMGNKISKERIELIRSLKLGNIRETITDLSSEHESGSGTRVEIFIAGEVGNV